MTIRRQLDARIAVLILIAASFLIAACGATGANTNWPGLSTDGKNVYVAYGPGVVAVSVSESGFEQEWIFPAERGPRISFYAAPSVQDDRVVIGDYGAAGGFFNPAKTVTIYALPNQPGVPTPLWPNNQTANGSIVAPPLQIGNRVYVGTADNEIFALDAENGNPVWASPFMTEHSIWGQPAYKNDVLFVTSLDNSVYALSAGSGAKIWQKELSGSIAGSPVVNNDLVYVASFDHHIYALETSTGDVAWEYEAEDWIWSSPTYDDGVVYFADIKGNVVAANGQDGTILWQTAVNHPVQTSPVVVDDRLYLGSEGDTDDQGVEKGLLTAIDKLSGDTLWQKVTPAPLYTTPVIVGNSVVVAIQSQAGLLIAFDLENGEQQGTFPVPQ